MFCLNYSSLTHIIDSFCLIPFGLPASVLAWGIGEGLCPQILTICCLQCSGTKAADLQRNLSSSQAQGHHPGYTSQQLCCLPLFFPPGSGLRKPAFHLTIFPFLTKLLNSPSRRILLPREKQHYCFSLSCSPLPKLSSSIPLQMSSVFNL